MEHDDDDDGDGGGGGGEMGEADRVKAREVAMLLTQFSIAAGNVAGGKEAYGEADAEAGAKHIRAAWHTSTEGAVRARGGARTGGTQADRGETRREGGGAGLRSRQVEISRSEPMVGGRTRSGERHTSMGTLGRSVEDETRNDAIGGRGGMVLRERCGGQARALRETSERNDVSRDARVPARRNADVRTGVARSANQIRNQIIARMSHFPLAHAPARHCDPPAEPANATRTRAHRAQKSKHAHARTKRTLQRDYVPGTPSLAAYRDTRRP